MVGHTSSDREGDDHDLAAVFLSSFQLDVARDFLSKYSKGLSAEGSLNLRISWVEPDMSMYQDADLHAGATFPPSRG